MNRGAVSASGEVDRKGRAGRGGRARPRCRFLPLYVRFAFLFRWQAPEGQQARLLFAGDQSIPGVFQKTGQGAVHSFMAPVVGLLITADASLKGINWRKFALQSVVAAVSALQLNSPPTMAGR